MLHGVEHCTKLLNDLFLSLGIESWKPVLSNLLMPPLPFLLPILAGGRLMFRRRLLGWALLLFGVAGVWLSCTVAMSTAMVNGLLKPPRALSPSEITELRRSPKTLILVLGAGRYTLAPEYGVSNLTPMSVERLRYGVWLSRETGLPLGFSGGVGHGSSAGPSEADIAARIAEREFGRPLKFTEGQSRDTAENASSTVALLRPQGTQRIVLVTHGFHMRRALAAFERAKQRSGATLAVVAAPMGLRAGGGLGWEDWMPTAEGFEATRIALHEWLGKLAGA